MRNTSRGNAQGQRQMHADFHVPPYTSTLVVTKKLRFRATAGTAVGVPDAITYKECGDTVVMYVSANLAYQLFNVVRIVKVEIWSPAISASGTVTYPTAGIEFPGLTAGHVGDNRRVSDTSISMTSPAHVKLSPDPRSQASQWQSTANTSIAFALNYGAGAVVDVVLQFRLTDELRVSGLATSNTGTVGQIYYVALDGPGNNNLTPDPTLPTIN